MKCWKDISIEKFYFEASNHKFTDLLYLKQSTVKPVITNTLEEFIKCRLDNFSMSFILYYVNFSIIENK